MSDDDCQIAHCVSKSAVAVGTYPTVEALEAVVQWILMVPVLTQHPIQYAPAGSVTSYAVALSEVPAPVIVTSDPATFVVGIPPTLL